MKILMVAPQPFFRVRGTPINVRNMLETLSEAGHEVDLVCYPFGEDLNIKSVRIYRSTTLPGLGDIKVGPSYAKLFLDFLMFWSVLFRLIKTKYQVIHAIEESVFFCVPLKYIFGTKLIYDMDSHISDQLNYSGFVRSKLLLGLVSRFERWALRRSDAVLTVCRSLSDSVRKVYSQAKIVQIEDTPLQDKFIPNPTGAAQLRELHQIQNRKVVLYTGNFEAYQGVELLLSSVELTVKNYPEACFVIVGGEPVEVEKMRALTRQLKVADYCIFTGKKPLEDIPTFLTLADVLVAPRIMGTNTAHKIYGYMQSGKPIVATELETHTQVLSPECAILVQATPEALASGLVTALKGSEQTKQLGLMANRIIDAQYSLSEFRRKLCLSYDNLLCPS